MDKERILYDKFVQKLIELVDNPEVSSKELAIILKFLENNNIQATQENEGLKNLADKFRIELPFMEEEIDIKR